MLNWILQIVGTIGSCGGLWLLRKKKIISWPIFIIGNVGWIWLYYRTKLVLALFTMLIYQALNVLNWIEWHKDKKRKGEIR